MLPASLRAASTRRYLLDARALLAEAPIPEAKDVRKWAPGRSAPPCHGNPVVANSDTVIPSAAVRIKERSTDDLIVMA